MMLTDYQMQGALDKLFEQWGIHTRIVFAALVRAIMCQLNVHDSTSYNEVKAFLERQINDGQLAWVRGGGGVITKVVYCPHLEALATWFAKRGGWKSGAVTSKVIKKVLLSGQEPNAALADAIKEEYGKGSK